MKERIRGTHVGTIVCIFGIVCNLLLSAGKIAAGLLCGLVSVTADGFNNLSDCGSGIVALFSLRISGKPADKEHPYGHRRAEYIAAMITGFLILALAVEFARESVETILLGGAQGGHWSVYLILGVSVAVKAGMAVGYFAASRKLGSVVLRAAAADSLSDCMATAAVITGALLSGAGVPADGWAGAVVAVFIAWQGARVLSDAVFRLMGQAADPALTEKIRAIILSEGQIMGMHDLHTFSFGRGAVYATAHVEMDARLPALASHAVIDALEHRVLDETNVSLTLHLDPVDPEDGEALELGRAVRQAAEGIAEGLELHDFRLVRGRERKVIFDAGVPYGCKLTDRELQDRLSAVVRSLGDYEPVITVERE